MKTQEHKAFLIDLVRNSTENLLYLIEIGNHNQFRTVAINAPYLKVLDSKEEEIVGKSLEEVMPIERAKFFIDNYQKAIRTKKDYSYELSHQGKTREHIISTTISPIFDEGRECLFLLGIAQDITERRTANEILKKSEENYRTLFNNSLDGIYKSTHDGKFVEVNPALVKMLGYSSKEDLIAIDIKTQLYFDEGDRITMAVHEKDEYPIKKKDGSEIWVEDHGHYEYGADGEILFHHGILRDVTSRVEKQNELEQLLEITNNQNQRLQGFAHIVSHNIRSHSSNMSAIMDFMEAAKNPEETQEFLKMLKTSTGKLQETIGNLNEIITIHQDAQKAYVSKNLRSEIQDTLDVLNGDLTTHNIKVEIDIDSNIEISVIPAYLDSILLNLLSNAIKYRAEERPLVLKLSADCDPNFTSLSIADNGIGIDMAKFGNKLFGMYQTFHNNMDARGFGLYITKNEIEAMEGEIAVKSKLNEGSCFTVKFKKK